MEATLEQRRYAKGLAVRERAIAAASQLLAAKGYGGSSVAELAEQAGITRNQLFHHFGSKENLARECIVRARQAWTDDLLTPAGIFPEPINRLVFILDKLAEYHFDEDWPYFRLITCLAASQADQPPAVKDLVSETLAEIYQALRDLCKELKRGGGLPGGAKARVAAAQILACALGTAALAGSADVVPGVDVYWNLKALFTHSNGRAR